MKSKFGNQVGSDNMHNMKRWCEFILLIVLLLYVPMVIQFYPKIKGIINVKPTKLQFSKGVAGRYNNVTANGNRIKFTKFKYHQHKDEYKEIKPNKVLIMSSPRYGSSYTGLLFACHRQVFYMYEPMKVFPNLGMEEKLGYLVDVFQCKMERFFSKLKVLHPGNYQKWFDRITDNESYKNFTYRFTKRSIQDREKQCESSKLVVIKTVSIGNISDIMRLLSMDIKVLYLIRDPRAVAESRYIARENPGPRDILHNMTEDCLRNEYNIKVLHKKGLDSANLEIIRKNFRIVRYEDIMQFRNQAIDRIFQFVNLNTSENVYRFMADSPHVLHKQLIQRNDSNKPQLMKYDTVTRWMTTMHYALVQDIQRACNGFMESVGYLPVSENLYSWKLYKLSYQFPATHVLNLTHM